MLWTVTIILLLLWALGFVGAYTVGSWIHILLILALISAIISIVRRPSAI